MRAFIKALDEKAWQATLTGWTYLTKTDDAMKTILKLEETWSMEKDLLANYNSKALNGIFNAVDTNQFKHISTCEIANDSWKILEITYEGTLAIKMSKLQLLATRVGEHAKVLEDAQL
ncbi:hypothetical protein TIFTF001_033767 [Ficus carica]|uniref:Uncharacterized protein n=1 Tax=Ficus carica TaxID=3494 RepID=A0AA88E2N9_FICCA|nr:hypothetical protein TIFTF001_033767 [Ficus carica]